MLARNDPPASETDGRFRWAKLLYQERLKTRDRLDGAPGIALRLWDEEKRKFTIVPDSKKDELAVDASLMACTADGKQTCLSIAVQTGLSADFLLEVNKALYPDLKSVTNPPGFGRAAARKARHVVIVTLRNCSYVNICISIYEM